MIRTLHTDYAKQKTKRLPENRCNCKPISITPHHCQIACSKSGKKEIMDMVMIHFRPSSPQPYVLWYRCSRSRTKTQPSQSTHLNTSSISYRLRTRQVHQPRFLSLRIARYQAFYFSVRGNTYSTSSKQQMVQDS